MSLPRVSATGPGLAKPAAAKPAPKPSGVSHAGPAPRPSEFANRKQYKAREPIPDDDIKLGVSSMAIDDPPQSQDATSNNDIGATWVSGSTGYGAQRRKSVNRYSTQSTPNTRYWIGTYYPADHEQEDYRTSGTIPTLRLDYEREDVTCWRGQWEWGGKADKNGKLHCQFAVAFRDQVRAPQGRRILGGVHGPFTGYLEPAFSKNVWDYVTKEASRVAAIDGYGSLADDQGHRSDLDVLYEHIAAGMPLWDVMSRFPKQFMRNHAAVSKLCAMYDKPRPYGPVTVEIWWGPTGTGKSHNAFHMYPEAYRKTIPGKWWEGYKGETTVVFEEFNPNEDKELRLPEILKILDKYPYQIEIKGASLQLRANHFIFTTNMDPRTWFDGHPQQAALARRVNKVRVFTTSYEPGMSPEEFEAGILDYEGMQSTMKTPFVF
nr:replication-associated protein [Tick-associated circular virus-4]